MIRGIQKPRAFSPGWRAVLVCGLLLLSGCATTPTALEQGSRPIAGYLDYSYDKNSVLFSTKARDMRTVFFDTFYPFDPSLRYKNAEPIVRYELDHKPFIQDGVLMVALADLRKIYAPFFSYTVDPDNRRFTVQHHFFRKQVVAGSGSRAPKIDYTKQVWQGAYALASTAATISQTTHRTVNDRDAIDASPIATVHPERAVSLGVGPLQRAGRIYVPVASFMRSLGKTTTSDHASGFLAVSHVGPNDTADDLFRPEFADRGLPNTPLTPARIETMNGLLDGSIRTGNLWFAYYLGDIRVFSGKTDTDGNDVHTTATVDRVLPYRLYVPARYDPKMPSKFTFNLHGATGNENAPFERPNEHLKHHPSTIAGVNSLEGFANHFNYIVLSPNGWIRNPVWGSGVGEYIMLHTLDRVKQDYEIDPRRMFIFGNSAGGAGAMNFVLRHGELFKAMAPTAPSRAKPSAAQLTPKFLRLPTLMTCFAADVTVFYAGAMDRSCQTWYAQEMKKAAPNMTAVTLENGHHSFGPASVFEMTFSFFERVLDKTPSKNVSAVRLVSGSDTAIVTDGTTTSSVKLATPPFVRQGTWMVSLDDLATVYGRADFRVYDVHAYNRTREDMVSVKTVVFNQVSVNIKPGERFLRVGGTVHAGDTIDGKVRVAAKDPRIDPRTLSVPAEILNGKLHVPVVEFMQLFGKSVTVAP